MRAAVASGSVLLVLALAACGGSGSSGEAGKSAQDIVADAVKSAKAAHSVRMSGSIPGPTSSLAIDVQVAKPSSAKGTISLGGTNVRIVRVGNTVYLYGDRGFWTKLLGVAAAKSYAGKWLKASATQSSLAGYARLTDINQFFNGTVNSRGTLEKKGTTTYKGQKVIAIVDNGKSGGTFYVAASGTPYPVAIVAGSGSKSGAIRFGDWNQPVSVTPPKGAIPLPLG